MSFLTEKDIMELLKTKEPDEILAEKGEQLDKAGRNLLAELREDMQAGEAFFEEFGRQFREADAEGLASPGEKEKSSRTSWFKGAIKIPHWALATAAVLASVAVLPTLLDWGDPTRTRGRSVDLEAIHPINSKLVEVLIERGAFLLEAGNKEGERDHYEEARNDLMQAYELDPNNIELLSLLARIHEKLGENQKAQRYFEEWQAAQNGQEEPRPD